VSGFLKVKEIVVSWAIAANPSEEQKVVAQIRLHICNGDIVDAYGRIQICDYLGDSLGIPYCKKCSCPMKGKVFTPRELGGCPLNKWSI